MTNEINSTPAPAAVAVPSDALESVRVLLRVAKNQSNKAGMAHAIGVVQAEVEKAAAHIDAGPAQEHATQLAGQGQEPSPPSAVTGPIEWPATCDGLEQEAWEAWGRVQGFDMVEHPMHYLFLNERTDAARQGWKGGLVYAVEQMKQRVHVVEAAPDQAHEDARDALTDKPEAGRYVLAWTEGAKVPIRAMWVPQFFLEMAEDDAESGEYSEAKDQYFCPEGWYENNAHEETHWNVDKPVVAWMELPRLAAARAAQGGAA